MEQQRREALLPHHDLRGFGTPQHYKATDLSKWLVHLAHTREDLISILQEGVIRASGPYGVGRDYAHVKDQHKVVCLTEVPLHELHRMTVKRPWGIVFDKEELRSRLNAQPVWYIKAESPQWTALSSSMEEAKHDSTAAIWKLTPFIDLVRARDYEKPYDWRWEREWRVQGELPFVSSDIGMILGKEGDELESLKEISEGISIASHNDFAMEWLGEFYGPVDEELERQAQIFLQVYATPSECNMPWETDEDRSSSEIEILDTAAAVQESFNHLPPKFCKKLEERLSHRSDFWCRSFDYYVFYYSLDAEDLDPMY